MILQNQDTPFHNKGFSEGKSGKAKKINPAWSERQRKAYLTGYRVGERERDRK